ncbi:hypothetical protein E8E13_001968 [Curvularia kusanoi]|uniref:Uncharacterized protein n=1 Tax=Curvularia kusanoi TaxID=90978 RepID=A0A9P4W2A7_CURKU|nr:hypothetical protein E8E13_001968 [Curvularia kusanoi]
MGRGAYDLTDPGKPKSAMAEVVLRWEDDNKEHREEETSIAAAAAYELKLIRNKKSRGIVAAKNLAKERDAAKQA